MRGDVIYEDGRPIGVSVWSDTDPLLPEAPHVEDDAMARWERAVEIERSVCRRSVLAGADGRRRKRRCLLCGERSDVRLIMGACERCREARR